MTKKLLCVITLVLMLATALISCGNDSTHTHAFGEWETSKSATCTEEGSKERYCSCGEKQTSAIQATGHTFGEWETVKEATKEEEGSKERTCACGEKETQKIDKIQIVTTITKDQWKKSLFDISKYRSFIITGVVKGNDHGINFDYTVTTKVYGKAVDASYTGICEHGESSIKYTTTNHDVTYLWDSWHFLSDDVGEDLHRLLRNMGFDENQEPTYQDNGYFDLIYSETDKSYHIYHKGNKFVFWFEDGTLVKFAYEDAELGKLSGTYTLSDFNSVEGFSINQEDALNELTEVFASIDSSTVFFYYDEDYNKCYIDTEDVLNHFSNLDEAEFTAIEKSIYEDTFDYRAEFDSDSEYYNSVSVTVYKGEISSIYIETYEGYFSIRTE